MSSDTQINNGPEEEELSIVQKIVGIFTAPAKTFASIDLSPSWIIPLALILAVNLVFVYFANDIILEETLVQQEEAMVERGTDAEQIDAALTQVESWIPISVWVLSIIGPPIILAIVSGVFLFVGNVIFGGKTSFKKVLSVTAWSWLIFSLAGLVMLPLVLSQETMQISFSLATFMSEESKNTFLYLFLQKIEVFTIWWIAVYSIGLGVIYKTKTQKMATAVGVVYFIYAVVASALGGMFS
ncbi:MAG: hypothetical protein E2O76_03520 [Caldithrix sp.]|nr:MAG: hypothetical protein E2O76_03520 [Caldithrix sp.]